MAAQITLHVGYDDYLVQKVTATAKIAKIPMVVKKTTAGSLTAILPEAKSMVMTPASGPPITQHLSILRFLAEATPAAGLVGANSFDGAQVDQWLHFTWHDIGT